MFNFPTFVGIDNGLNGGIVVLDDAQTVLYKYVMPTIMLRGKKEFDVKTIVNIFINLKGNYVKDIHVALEQAHVRPVSGKRACFTTGGGYYLMQGILTTLGISFEIVPPRKWQKELLSGLGTDTKQASIMYCRQKWPQVKWTATEKSKKDHDGLTDAACLAVYIFRCNKK
jgi:hypothetical protein